jgi:hypothetical protein
VSYRKIAAIPLVWGVAFCALLAAFPAGDRGPLYLAGNEFSKALATFGCFAAAYAFERGDYMRRAWSLNAWCYLLLLTRDVVTHLIAPGSLLPFGHMKVELVEGTLALVANASSTLGCLFLARAWQIAGLEYPGSRAGKIALMLGVAAFALGVSGTDLMSDGAVLLGGDLGALHLVASDLGDIFSLCLLAPMLLTAVAMTGGSLRWPWGLLTASLVFWLFYDATSTLDHILPGHEATTQLARGVFRALACAAECAAGLAQRRVVTAPEAEQLE